jgi:hypothetical protein
MDQPVQVERGPSSEIANIPWIYKDERAARATYPLADRRSYALNKSQNALCIFISDS